MTVLATAGDLQAVNDHVAAFGKPEALTLADDIHIFHFDRSGNWRENDAGVLFVNRNGHHFRLIQEADGQWRFAKTWNGIHDVQDWQVAERLRRDDPLQLIKLCCVGPQGNKFTFEGLCLLPKGTTSGRRKAVWRGHMLDVAFNRDADSFSFPEHTASFSGKPWESQLAASWCLANLKPCVPVGTPEQQAASREELAEVLEGNPMWGMF